MEVFRSEVHNLLIRPFLDDTVEALGRERTEEIVQEWGVTVEQLSDANAWLSLEFVEAFFERLDEARNDPTLFQRCARMVVTPKYAGFLRPLFRAFGSPGFAIAQVTRATARFNKVGRMELEDLRGQGAVITYGPLEGAPAERSPLVCRARAANLEALPMMFDVPPAYLEHSRCLHRGDGECRYELRWKLPRRAFGFWTAALAAAAAGLLLVGVLWPGGLHVPLAAAATATLLVAGGLYVRDLRRQLGDRMDDIAAQQDALTRSAEAHERRFAELVEAKEHVDQQVADRTAELREARDRLTRALTQVEEMSQAKDRFFANVSHELRTPLTLILGPLEELAAGREPPGGRQRAFAAMRRNASRLLTLINQLLDLAKVDAGAMELHREPLDLATLVSEVVDGFVPSARSRGVRLTLEAPDAVRPLVADAGWIESAVTNLVANATKWASSSVRVRLVDTDRDVRLEVRDDGPGLEEDQAAKIFERFAQARSLEERGGTGLGLAIVREAARLHGGEAAVDSEPGRGSTFVVTLPRSSDAPAERPPAPAKANPPRGMAGPPLDPAPSTAPRAGSDDPGGPGAQAPLALVVEDNDDLRAYIADVLSARYRVETAADGARGLDLAISHRPQVVVSDISMPDLDGLTMTRRLRERDETRTTPIILVTAHRAVATVLEGFEAGADDYVAKPFHGRELLARVDVHVRLRQMVREMAHRERLATLGVISASVAHQVRNPLTVLQSGLPAVRKRLADGIDEPTREILDVMIGCARRIERMTVDLLDLSRVDRAESDLFRPGEGLSAACRLVGAGLPSQVDLRVDVDESSRMYGRPGDVNHVFLNLVDNAARAVGEEGVVEVTGRREGEDYLVYVDDSGPGVASEVAQQIFEPFWTSRPAGEGTGLGLSIARQVVDQHGGTIGVDRSPLGGARFALRLPLGTTEDEEGDDNGVLAYGGEPSRRVE